MIAQIKPHILVVQIPVNATKIKLSIIGKDNYLIYNDSDKIKLPVGDYEIIGVFKMHEQDYIYSLKNKDLQIPLITPEELEANGFIITNKNKYIIIKKEI